MPALPLDEAGNYVAGAYLVFVTLVVVYVAIISFKIARIERQVDELVELVDEDARESGRSRRSGGPAPSSERGAGDPAEMAR
jgi:hypothetical protein